MKNETVFTELTLKFLMEEEISHQFSKGLLICEIQICGAEVTKFSNRTGTIHRTRELQCWQHTCKTHSFRLLTSINQNMSTQKVQRRRTNQN